MLLLLLCDLLLCCMLLQRSCYCCMALVVLLRRAVWLLRDKKIQRNSWQPTSWQDSVASHQKSAASMQRGSSARHRTIFCATRSSSSKLPLKCDETAPPTASLGLTATSLIRSGLSLPLLTGLLLAAARSLAGLVLRGRRRGLGLGERCHAQHVQTKLAVDCSW